MTVKKILVIRSSSMGDVIHALPAAFDIKQALPEAQLDWVIEESFRDVTDLSPFIDNTIVTAFRRWRKHPLSAVTRREVSDLRHLLRENHYDIVIDLQGLIRTALIARWCGVKSVGYSKNTIREPLASYFYSETEEVPESLTPVRRYRVMAARCLGYTIDEEHPQFGLKAKPLTEAPCAEPFAVLAVNTSREEKLWARERWAAATNALVKSGITPLFVWGNQKEKSRVEDIAAQVRGAVVAPHMRIPEIASVMKDSVGVIGVDTGLSHLAAALAVPAVGIIVGTSAQLFSLVSEGKAVTVGDKGVIPGVSEVLDAFAAVTGRKVAV